MTVMQAVVMMEDKTQGARDVCGELGDVCAGSAGETKTRGGWGRAMGMKEKGWRAIWGRVEEGRQVRYC